MAEAQASPTQATNTQFATAFRGYDQAQVDEHLSTLREELASAARHRDDATASVAELTKALSYAQKELADSKTALARMVDDPAGPAAMTERVKTMMQLAEEEIAELRAKAEQDAADTREAADAYAEKTRNKAQADAEQLAEQAAAERTRLDEEAQRQRDEQRKSTEDQLAADRERAENEAAELRRVTEEKADAMIAEAESRLAEARSLRREAYELRSTVLDRLTASQSALRQAVDRLGNDPAPEDESTESEPKGTAESGDRSGEEKQPA
ncbi:cell division protein DivIVA [Saccharomonospora piscinae]|uniref:Cell wall synthesis protein Wag31 n=1 Tax=Saccharomonospora piscinae TaxID=687388 RepID=A0A1V9A6Q5_SACPI|nr:DivIVA domain-containing protein [Saccharomonospora piscinae]OQO92815.1 cell division protein DivIVA [Saccharomonospora piscinae]